MKHIRKRFYVLAICITVLLILVASGCGTSKSTQNSRNTTEMQNQGAPAEVSKAEPKGATDTAVGDSAKQLSTTKASSIPAPQLDRKVIKTALLSIETLQYDRTVDGINKQIIVLGGYIETSNVSGSRKGQEGMNRKAHFEVRIPSKSLDQFMTNVGDLGNIISKENHGEDITGQYFDVDAHVKTLRIQEERLLTILQKAEKLQDIIELERELTQVRYEIENFTGTLQKWDNMVEYSKITLDVYEVREITKLVTPPTTLWGRIVKAFTGSVHAVGQFLMDVLVFMFIILPPLVIMGVIACIIIGIVRISRRKRKPTDGTPLGK